MTSDRSYTPSPIPTEHVRLPSGLDSLVEQLAEHVHDVWSAERLAEGWTYGPQRDDVAKAHPGLVPYSELSESEKEYDRRTAMGTLKAVLALGYRLVPPDS